MAIISQKTVVDFKALTAAVNARLGADHSQNYVSNVYSGIQKSSIVKEAIDAVLAEDAVVNQKAA
jgi:hypothetical protein